MYSCISFSECLLLTRHSSRRCKCNTDSHYCNYRCVEGVSLIVIHKVNHKGKVILNPEFTQVSQSFRIPHTEYIHIS